MIWKTYEQRLRDRAEYLDIEKNYLEYLVVYSKNLYSKKLPIIFDQTHFSLLLGINNEYLHRMSNAPNKFYREFHIMKRNGKLRQISEPLPDLKKVQSWILKEILYQTSCSKFAKAYIPTNSIKSNTRFHVNRNTVITIDLKDFFTSIKLNHVLKVYLSLGYNLQVSTLLAHLCCLKKSLPQGAPTSAYLSNLVLYKFDENIGKYCIENNIRYTRYADDLTFSGEIDIAKLLFVVDKNLLLYDLKRNNEKFKVMRSNARQIVTGVVVNKKMQLSRNYRMKIRQEVYFINKFGLDNHLEHINEKRMNYIEHLIGKIKYALFINPNDKQMMKYLNMIKEYEEIR